MNFAGVWKAPCIFFCRNNGWAISTPSATADRGQDVRRQGASPTACPGIRVDGNDLLAVIAGRCSEAVARARAGEGPTLIEALTYRSRRPLARRTIPAVYRDPEGARDLGEEGSDRALAPLPASTRGLWTEALRRSSSDVNQEITDALGARSSTPRARPPPVETMFDDVYARAAAGTCASSSARAAWRSRAPRTRSHGGQLSRCPS